MILCDTNVLIEFYKNNPRITAELRQIGLGNLAVSVITVAELYFGALNKSELKKIKENLALMHQIPVTRDIS
ncbi:MAG: PIN domain-containing protein, partial [Anaerolineaceae bacterium]